MKHFFLFIFLISSFIFTKAQDDIHIARIAVNKQDTLPSFDLGEVVVFTKREFASNKERWEFERLKRNTTKVYPYVKMAVEIYNDMSENVEGKRKRAQKRYIKEKEKDIREQFEEEIRSLSKSQGEILIKLINRETGNSCYQIVKELKNPFTAFFWHVGGKMFGHDLKEEYLPEENQDLEFIVQMLKNE